MDGAKTSPNSLFDRPTVRIRRDRAARVFADFDFLLRRCEEDFLDRLATVHQARFSDRSLDVLVLGSHTGFAAGLGDRMGAASVQLVQADASAKMAGLARSALFSPAVVAEEDWLPFRDESFDLILCPLTLHFANDLPGALIQIRRALKPGGLFLSSLFGGETLAELRQSLANAEIEVEGGLSPRVIPFTDVKDYGALLQRAGYHEPVSDLDRVTVEYSSFESLVRDLRGMGLPNPMTERRKEPMSRKTRARAIDHYQEDHGGPDGLSTSFHLLYGTAWAPES